MTTIPHLTIGAKLAFDEVRGMYVMHLPERIVQLNDTAAAILHLCNGVRSVESIVGQLGEEYDVDESDVRQFIADLIQSNLLCCLQQ